MKMRRILSKSLHTLYHSYTEKAILSSDFTLIAAFAPSIKTIIPIFTQFKAMLKGKASFDSFSSSIIHQRSFVLLFVSLYKDTY